jgi:GMP synthase-like glutamine amidotransferase
MNSLQDDISEYRVYKDTYLFLYTNEGDVFNILLTRDKIDEQYSPFRAQVYKYDNSPPYAISRLMCTKYKGLLSNANIEKLISNEEIMTFDLLSNSESTSYWDSPLFWEFLDKLSLNEYFQYDKDNSKFYFLKIPLIDVEKLNKNLYNLGLDFEFTYSPIEQNVTNLLAQIGIYEPLRRSLFTSKPENNFIVLSCKPPGKSLKDQAGIFHFPALFQSLYKRPNENWLFYTASIDGFPGPDELKNTKAIIIPGSQIHVYDDHEYLRKAEHFIKEVHSKYPEIKFLGICFGAQIIAEVYGGKVQSREDGFYAGLERLKLKKSFFDLDFIKPTDLIEKKFIEILKFHGDEITKIPQGFIHLAESKSCKYELLISEDKNTLLIQGHPEYDCYFEYGRSIGKVFVKEKIENSIENLKEYEKDHFKKMKYHDYNMHEMRKLCYNFLKYRKNINNIN